MVLSCLLCLNSIKDKIDSIETNSALWKELDIGKKLEKHFWSLSTIQPNSWICLPCWQEVEEFNKFYLRIEEAHMNFYKIKVEDAVECKQESTQIAKIIDYNEESNKANMTYCFLEPEILIDAIQQQLTESDGTVGKEIAISTAVDEMDVNDKPLNQTCKRQKLQNDDSKRRKAENELANRDPLAKSKKLIVYKTKRNKNYKEKNLEGKALTEELTTNDLTIKEEPLDFSENDSESASDNDGEKVDTNYLSIADATENVKSTIRKYNGKNLTKREENDKFIAEHFKHMLCDVCQLPLKDFPDMQKHFSDVHGQQGYFVCCKRKYFYRRLLIDHLHSHLNPDHFKCDQCGKVMSDRLRLEKHIMWIHKSGEALKKHSCEICGKSFAAGHYLRMHKLTHLPEEEKKFPCEECGKSYGSSYLLQRHIEAVHLKKFVKICHICGKFLNCSSDYKMHMNKHEGIPQPVINCDVCGLRLTTERGLKRHKDSQHPVDGKKEHYCPECPKVSPTLEALRKHINRHVKGYGHKCTICAKAFKRAEVLREHMASHTGTPLYTCPWCPKTFNSNGNMHAHRKKIHPKEWEEAKLRKYSGNIKPNITRNNKNCENKVRTV